LLCISLSVSYPSYTYLSPLISSSTSHLFIHTPAHSSTSGTPLSTPSSLPPSLLTPRFLRKWWKAETGGRVFFFFVVLAKALEVFGFRTAGEHKQRSVMLGPRQPTSTTINKMVDPIKHAAMKQGSKNSFGTLARRRLKLRQQHKDGLQLELSGAAGASPHMKGESECATPTRSKTPRSEGSQSATIKRRAYLSLEVNSVVLELLLHFMADFKGELGELGNKHMDRVVCNFLLLLLKQNQSELFLTHLFQTVRFLVYNFPKPLFLHTTPYVGDLTYELLRACNFASEHSRSQATGVLYIFFKTNWLIKKNLARMKLQCSVAIAKLVGEGGIADVARLQAALLTVVTQAKREKNPPEFVRQLEQLLSVRLITVLENTKLIEQFEYDNGRFCREELRALTDTLSFRSLIFTLSHTHTLSLSLLSLSHPPTNTSCTQNWWQS
jgi:hypothetical protein